MTLKDAVECVLENATFGDCGPVGMTYPSEELSAARDFLTDWVDAQNKEPSE